MFRRTSLRTNWYVTIHLFNTGSICYNKLFRGESAGDSQDASDSPGFEVDLRVVKDTMSRRRKEADKAKVEIARFNPSMIKITNDRTKLLIESKTTLVKLIKEVPEKNKDYCYPWSTDHRYIKFLREKQLFQFPIIL